MARKKSRTQLTYPITVTNSSFELLNNHELAALLEAEIIKNDYTNKDNSDMSGGYLSTSFLSHFRKNHRVNEDGAIALLLVLGYEILPGIQT